MFKRILTIFAIISLSLVGSGWALADENSAGETTSIAVVEPIIRVGLAKTSKLVVITSSSSLGVWFNGAQRITTEPNGTVTVSWKNGQYNVKSGDTVVGTKDPIRFIPLDSSEALVTISSLNRTLKGHGGRPYHTYRGVIEYRYSPKSGMAYLINELSIEDYLKGLTETAPHDPDEYLKALVVAARSYAYAHISKTPPTDKRLFDVFASTQDQLYMGYESELRLPEVAAAAVATRGEFVTYDGQPVITTYFSHSNGKTKTWPSKTSPRVWITSVKAPYDKGLRQSGHGYGMSLHDAIAHAKKDGWSYLEILQYYYTGIAVEKLYE